MIENFIDKLRILQLFFFSENNCFFFMKFRFYDRCTRRKLPPALKLTLIVTQTLTGGQFSTGAIVRIPKFPSSNFKLRKHSPGAVL